MSSFPHSRGPAVGQHVGDYEIVSHLARGDMGEVYQAHHPKSGRQVAIKVLDADLCADPQLLRYYEHEVWTVNHLGHPAIVDVLDFGKLDSGRAYLVMKLLRGRSLAEHLAERGQFAPETVRELLRPALEALIAVHGAGITHKDIKPSNIFLVARTDGSFEPKLLDCGLAHLKPLAAVPGSAAQASSGLPLYSAPEQMSGDLAAVGPWSDIYSVAAVIYHLLAGRPPFVGTTAEEVVQQHLHTPPPDLAAVRSDAHPKLCAVLQQGMAKRPVERFESIGAFLKAFMSASALRAPTLRGPMGAPPEPPGVASVSRAVVAPVGVPTAPLPQDHTPAPLGMPTAMAPRHDRTPPPTMRIEPGRFPMPLAAVSQPAARPAQDQRSFSPPAVADAQAPKPPKRRVGFWFLIAALGLLVTGTVIFGLVFMLGEGGKGESSGKKGEKKGEPMAPVKPAMAMARPPAMAVVMAPTPAVVHPPPRKVLRYRVDITGRPWRGALHARVTVALYCGFSSSICREQRKIFQKLLDEFPKDMKLVWMDFPKPFLKRAMPAAVAAAEVFAQRGSKVFWKYHDQLYDHPFGLSDANLVRWAQKLGASETKVREALESSQHRAFIKKLVSKAQNLGIRHPPALVINGIRVTDTSDYDDLESEVRAEVAEANRVIAKQGVALKDYYAYLQKNARTPLGTLGGKTLSRYKYYGPWTVYHMPVSSRNPQRGPADALVTLVLFGDFECIFTFRLTCALKALLAKYPKDVRLVWMNRPVSYHRRAVAAAESAMAGFAQKGSKGFWAMHDRIFPMGLCLADGSYGFGFFRHSKKLDAAFFRAAARKSGLKLDRYKRELRLHTHLKQIRSEEKLAKAFRIHGTPVLFINGKKHSGSKRLAELIKLVKEARAAAKRVIRSKSVSRSKLYDVIIARGVVGRIKP